MLLADILLQIIEFKHTRTHTIDKFPITLTHCAEEVDILQLITLPLVWVVEN